MPPPRDRVLDTLESISALVSRPMKLSFLLFSMSRSFKGYVVARGRWFLSSITLVYFKNVRILALGFGAIGQ